MRDDEMPEPFDPYHRWLGIPPKGRPPTYYRLLGLEPFESDPEVIRDAAERQMAHVRRYALGRHLELSQKILNELGAAKACLMDAAKKDTYDQHLRAQPTVAPESPAAPIASDEEDVPPRIIRADFQPPAPPIRPPAGPKPLADALPHVVTVAQGVGPEGRIPVRSRVLRRRRSVSSREKHSWTIGMAVALSLTVLAGLIALWLSWPTSSGNPADAETAAKGSPESAEGKANVNPSHWAGQPPGWRGPITTPPPMTAGRQSWHDDPVAAPALEPKTAPSEKGHSVPLADKVPVPPSSTDLDDSLRSIPDSPHGAAPQPEPVPAAAVKQIDGQLKVDVSALRRRSDQPDVAELIILVPAALFPRRFGVDQANCIIREHTADGGERTKEVGEVFRRKPYRPQGDVVRLDVRFEFMRMRNRFPGQALQKVGETPWYPVGPVEKGKQYSIQFQPAKGEFDRRTLSEELFEKPLF